MLVTLADPHQPFEAGQEVELASSIDPSTSMRPDGGSRRHVH